MINAPSIRVRFSLASKFFSLYFVLYSEKTKINEKDSGNGPSFVNKIVHIYSEWDLNCWDQFWMLAYSILSLSYNHLGLTKIVEFNQMVASGSLIFGKWSSNQIPISNTTFFQYRNKTGRAMQRRRRRRRPQRLLTSRENGIAHA